MKFVNKCKVDIFCQSVVSRAEPPLEMASSSEGPISLNSKRLLAFVAAFGTLAFAAQSVHAVLLKITIKATATTQNSPTTNNSVVTFATTKTSVATRDVLTTLGTIEGVAVPDSAKLIFDTVATTNNIFTIRKNDGGIIKDVTSHFKFTRGEGVITSGAINNAIGTKSSIKETFIGTFTFQPDNGNDFTIVGLTVDEREQSTRKTNEVKMNETISLSGSGTGHIGGVAATVTGKVYGLWESTTVTPATNTAPISVR